MSKSKCKEDKSGKGIWMKLQRKRIGFEPGLKKRNEVSVASPSTFDELRLPMNKIQSKEKRAMG